MPVCDIGEYASPGSSDAQSVFEPFRQPILDRPFVVAQLGQSLDGRIATISGESRYINGPAALDHLHSLRAHVDAVVVGCSTVLADDPQLTVRRYPGGKHPARVVIDPNGRLDGTGKWLEADGIRRILVRAAGEPGSDVAHGAAAKAGVECLSVATQNGQLAPRSILDALFAAGMKRILIEGGANTIARFLDAECLDRLHVLVSPVLIGSGRAGIDLKPVADLALARRPVTHVHLLGGGDVLFDCDLSSCRHVTA